MLAACGFSQSLSPTDGGDGPPIDMLGNESVAGRVCYGTFPEVCLPAAPTTPLDVMAATTIDTDDPSACATTVDGTAAGMCVVAGSSVTIAATLRAIGAKPLVIVSASTLMVSGTIDVSSKRGMPGGAGRNFAGCVDGTDPGDSGGGQGGSFRGPGGNGGTGGQGPGGMASPAVDVTMLRGGCDGGDGGDGDEADGAATAGDGGDGGGAVSLVARMSISLGGAIHASGAAGSGGISDSGGGGGGGSGGMVVLDAPAITIATGAIVVAQGAGGGEGASLGATSGAPGFEPTVPGVFAAGGGGATTTGGDGGAGGVTAGGSSGPAAGAGGGGGGGGTGAVRATSTPANLGVVSPPLGG